MDVNLHRAEFALSALVSWRRFDNEIMVSMNGRQTEPTVNERVNS
jgi:hypothetical protein